MTGADLPTGADPPAGVQQSAAAVPGGPMPRWRSRLSGPVWDGLIQLLLGRDPVPQWPSERHRRRTVVALRVATALMWLLIVARAGEASAAYVVLGVWAAAPLLLAARHPLIAWRIAWLGLMLASAGDIAIGRVSSVLLPMPALLVVFYAAGVRNPRPVLWWMWGLTLAPWWLWNGLQGPNFGGHVAASLLLTAAAMVVDSIRSRRHAEHALEEATELTELEQARRAVLTERARIARELHDVVAHHMSLIAVRAETAPYRLSDLPEPVQAEFAALSSAARDALADMRRLLGVLRQDQRAERAPQPGLSDLPGLVGAAREAGMEVELDIPGTLDHVPSSVAVCAYRIVQESLSNASRHAPGATVTASVEESGGALRLRILNGRPASGVLADGRADTHSTGGHGLAGMRERAALLGGSLAAGPMPDGGFAVTAVLPMKAVA